MAAYNAGTPMFHADPDTAIGGGDGRFPDTRSTLIDRLHSDNSRVRELALGEIAAVYWKPLYKTIRIQWGKSNEEAKDLTQSFLAMILDRSALDGFDPARGTFRTYIRTLLARFVANEIKSSRRLKRGGDLEAVDFELAEAELRGADAGSPDEIFHREWIRSLLEGAVARLKAELATEGKPDQFELFRRYDLERSGESYRALARELGIDETTVTNRLAAARRRFRGIVLETIRGLTASEEEFRNEVRALLGVDP